MAGRKPRSTATAMVNPIYVPKLGAFVIYTMMIVILILRPNGLFGRTAQR